MLNWLKRCITKTHHYLIKKFRRRYILIFISDASTELLKVREHILERNNMIGLDGYYYTYEILRTYRALIGHNWKTNLREALIYGLPKKNYYQIYAFGKLAYVIAVTEADRLELKAEGVIPFVLGEDGSLDTAFQLNEVDVRIKVLYTFADNRSRYVYLFRQAQKSCANNPCASYEFKVILEMSNKQNYEQFVQDYLEKDDVKVIVVSGAQSLQLVVNIVRRLRTNTIILYYLDAVNDDRELEFMLYKYADGVKSWTDEGSGVSHLLEEWYD